LHFVGYLGRASIKHYQAKLFLPQSLLDFFSSLLVLLGHKMNGLKTGVAAWLIEGHEGCPGADPDGRRDL
jgi:hypothetical protein